MPLTIQEFIEKFASEFAEVETSDINADTIFRELDEWSSMQALIIIAMIEEEFGVLLSADDMKSAQTIGDIYSKIQNS